MREAEIALADATCMGHRERRVAALVVAARALLALGRAAEAEPSSRAALELRDELGGVEEDQAEVFLRHALALADTGREREACSIRVRGRARL